MWSAVLALVGWSAGWWLFGSPRLLGVRPGDVHPSTVYEVPPISIVIPARNESASLPNLLGDLSRARPIGSEVIVVDDCSTDDTRAIALGFDGVSVFDAGPTPDGWLGKSWACHIGAHAARSEVLVFLDADVRVEPGAIEAVIRELQSRGGLVSVEPYHEVEQHWEDASALFATVSVMGIGAGRSGEPMGAFGPVMATTRADYDLVGGHRAVRAEIVEDIALARRYSAADRSVSVMVGGPELRFRMYPDGPRSMVEGWTKNFATGAGSTPKPRLAAAVLWLAAMGTTISMLAGSMGQLGQAAGALTLCGLFAWQVGSMFSRLGNFSRLAGVLYPLWLAVFFAVFFRSLWATRVRRAVQWRGREVPLTLGSNA